MPIITKEEVDSTWKEIEEFERVIPGIRYGEDYPEFALAIVGSESFKRMVQGSTMMGLLSAIMMKPPKEDAPEEEKHVAFEKMMSASPQRDTILQALYLGYKLGKMK